MSNDFVNAPAPASGDRIDWDQTLGKLVVVEPLSVETGIQTVNGISDAVRANVYVITGHGTSDDFSDVLVFPKVLQGQLRGQIGSKVVGRLAKGDAKPGKSAPWLLLAATEDDLAKAREWLAARNSTQFASAAPASQGAQAPF